MNVCFEPTEIKDVSGQSTCPRYRTDIGFYGDEIYGAGLGSRGTEWVLIQVDSVSIITASSFKLQYKPVYQVLFKWAGLNVSPDDKTILSGIISNSLVVTLRL